MSLPIFQLSTKKAPINKSVHQLTNQPLNMTMMVLMAMTIMITTMITRNISYPVILHTRTAAGWGWGGGKREGGAVGHSVAMGLGLYALLTTLQCTSCLCHRIFLPKSMSNHLVGQVSASRAEDPGFDSRLHRGKFR